MNAQHDNMNAAAPPPGPPSASGAPSPTAPSAGRPWIERPEFAQRRKSPPLACLLSVMPGLGQVYVGYYRLGFVHVIVFGSVISLLAFEAIPALLPMLGIFLAFFLLYNIVDAGRRATLYNQALAGMEGVSMPQENSLPAAGGSIFGGVILIVVGFILLTNTVFDMSLRWLEDWWPVAPIALGVYLVVREMMDRAGKKDPA